MTLTQHHLLQGSRMALLEELLSRMTTMHGELIGGPALYKALGFEHADTFRKAKAQGRLSVATFSIPGRRGDFAVTHQVASWISKLPFEEASSSLEVESSETLSTED